MEIETSTRHAGMTEVEKLGIPIVVMGATYGVFATILTAWEKLNDRRDLVVGIVKDDKITLNGTQKSLVFSSDWLPMYVGVCLFLLMFTIIALMIPSFVRFQGATFNRSTALICRLVGGLFGFGFLAYLVGGIMDGCAMFTYISKGARHYGIAAGILLFVISIGAGWAVVKTLRRNSSGIGGGHAEERPPYSGFA